MDTLTDQLSVVSADWVEANLDSVVVVDVREQRDFRELGHVPGAVNLPYETFRDPGSVSAGKLPAPEAFETQLGELGIEPDDTLVAYDEQTGVYAARFLLTAIAFGHQGELKLLDGGFEAWQGVGETTTDRSSVESTSYEVSENEALIASRDDVQEAADGEAALVDTRTPAEYNQAHIPGAIQLGWEEVLEDGRLRPKAEIQSLLDEKGLDPDQRIVLYCNTARRLSHTFVLLAHLGYEHLEFYEGSLTDWVRAESPRWNPVQLYEDVREIAHEGFEAIPRELGDDVFSRLHLIGLYTQKQDGYFMLRTKVPGGRLTAEQARTFGEIAEEFARAPPEHGGADQNPEFGDGYFDVTTRQGLQMHWIRIEDMPEIWDRYDAVGLTTIQASGNTLRNVVMCPAAGLGDETIDVRSLADDIADTFEGNTEYANLPRKLKISLTGCHENCGRAEIQDVGFTPAVKDGRDGFHVKIGGGLSDGPRAATDLGIFLEPSQVTELSCAVAELFIEHGSYLDTAVNRLKFIVEEWGTEAFREELQRYVDFEFESAGEDLTTGYRGDHVGVNPQTDGGYYVGLNVPTGRMLGEELQELADLAEQYGSGEIRTTANQNLVLPDVDEADLDALLAEPLLERYTPDPGPFSQGIVTCTGAEFCSYGVVETKNRGIRMARELDEWVQAQNDIDADELPDAVRVHMSGCSASCAQPQIADVGMRGERYRDDHAEVPAADVGLGGDLERGEFIDWVAGSVPLSDVPDGLRELVRAYAENQRRRPGGEDGSRQSLSEWFETTPDEQLRELLAEAQTHPTAATDGGVRNE